MTNLRPVTRLLGAVALFAFLTLPAQAQNRTADRGNDPRYENEWEIDRHNDRTYDVDRTVSTRDGVRFNVDGRIRLVADVRQTKGGEILVTGQATPVGLTVKRLNSDDRYRVRGTDRVEARFNAPSRGQATVERTFSFNVLTPRAEPDYRLLVTVEGDIDRAGNLVGRITDIEIVEEPARR